MADRYRGSREGIANSTEKTSVVVPETPTDNVFVDLRCDPRTRPILPATEFSGSHKKKATSSFQITSVTVQGSRLGNDAGEDSADDLDESHTEDISSEMLDCSKTTDLENDPLSSDNSNANLDDFGIVGLVLPTKQPIPVKTISKTNDTQAVNFSIGVSNSDFGQVAIGSVNSGVTLMTSTTATPPVVNAQVPMVNNSLPEHWQHRFKVVKIVSSEPFKRGRWLCMDFTDPPPSSHHEVKTLEAPAVPAVSDISVSAAVQSMHDPAIANSLIGSGIPQSEMVLERPNAMPPPLIYDMAPNSNLVGVAGMGMTMNPSLAHQPVYNLVPVTSTAPTTSSVNILSNIPFSSVPTLNQNAAIQITATGGEAASALQPAPPPQVHSNVLQQTSNLPHVSLQTQTPINLPHQPQVITNNHLASQNLAAATAGVQNTAYSSVNLHQTVVAASNMNAVASNPTVGATNEGNYASGQVTLTGPQSVSDIMAAAARLSAPLVNPSPLLDVLPDTFTTKTEGDDSESAPSGTSTVAIDNKIEQAMDLVKSHLMFAVREEVDVLKEKITELVDRISQLELENGILRANASQETLSQLTTNNTPGQQVIQTTAPPTAVIAPSVAHHMRPSPQLVTQTMPQQAQSAGQAPQQTTS